MITKPPLTTRLRLAWKYFQGGLPAVMSRPRPQASKASPLAWPSWREGTPQWQLINYEAYINEGFNLNSLVYSAVMYKARAAGAAKLRAYKGDPEEPELLPSNHPLAELTARPNKSQSWREYIMLQEVYLNLAGNAYTYMSRPRRGETPEALYPLRPDRTYIIPGKGGGIKGFIHVPEGKAILDGLPMLPEDVSHVKLPNPSDPLEGWGYGLSPLSAAAQSADVDNMITAFINMFFKRGARTVDVLQFEDPLTDAIASEIQERWVEKYGGYENWIKPAILDRGGKYTHAGMTFEEMSFEAQDERNETKMLGPFGVPLTLISTRSGMQAATYNNKESDRRMFWEDTMIPELSLFEDDLTYYLQSPDGGWVGLDLSDVPALRRNVPELTKAFVELVSTGISKNKAAATVGLTFGELEDGDVIYMPINMIPVGSSTPEPITAEEAPVPDAAEEEEEEGKRLLPETAQKKSLSPEAKEAHWKANDRTATSWEPKFRQAAIKAFEHDKRELLAMLNKGKREALEQKATIDWIIFGEDWLRYLLAESGEYWRSTFLPVIKGLIGDRAEQLVTAFGMQFDVQQLYAREHFNQYILKFADPIGETTSKEISIILNQAQREGWSIPTMQKNLSTLFEQWMKGNISPEEFSWFEERMPPYRTEMIARTETIRSSNFSSNEVYKGWGAKEKEWLATRDNRTRPDHAEADGQVVGIDEKFNVGGYEADFPGDPDLPPEESINCRCTELPVL